MTRNRVAAAALSTVLMFGVLAVAQAQSTAAPAAPAATMAKRPGDAGQSWRINFDRTAKADGVLHFRIWPFGADPIDIKIPVTKGQTENAMARITSDTFRQTLDNNDYRTDVKKNIAFLMAVHGNRRFALELVEKPEGTDIDLYRGGR